MGLQFYIVFFYNVLFLKVRFGRVKGRGRGDFCRFGRVACPLNMSLFPLRNRGIWAYLLNIFSYSSFTAFYISSGIFENEPSNIYQKSSDKAEYHTNEGEGKEKLKGLRSASEMCSIDWQYLSLGYLERNEFFSKSKS